MNFEQPPPYQTGPTAPTYPGQVPPQGYPAQGNAMQPNAGYPGYPPGPMGPAAPYPGPGQQPPYQGYPGQPQYGWQGGPHPGPGPVYGEPPKNTVYVVEDRRRDDSTDACLTGCWTALCCCCLWDMLT